MRTPNSDIAQDLLIQAASVETHGPRSWKERALPAVLAALGTAVMVTTGVVVDRKGEQRMALTEHTLLQQAASITRWEPAGEGDALFAAGFDALATRPASLNERRATAAHSKQEILFHHGFEDLATPPSPATRAHPSLPTRTSGARPPISARALQNAEEAWANGQYAKAAQTWLDVAMTTRDLEVADWAAKAAARTGDRETMARAGRVWRWAHGGLGEAAVRGTPEQDDGAPRGPDPGLTLFASLLSADGYLNRTYLPSHLQKVQRESGSASTEVSGSDSFALLQDSYRTWITDRSTDSHPFALELARQRRTPSNGWTTDDPLLNRWLDAFPDNRSRVLQEQSAAAQHRWNPALHDAVWARAETGNASDEKSMVAVFAEAMNRQNRTRTDMESTEAANLRPSLADRRAARNAARRTAGESPTTPSRPRPRV